MKQNYLQAKFPLNLSPYQVECESTNLDELKFCQ